jgi:hypothetical protein
MSDNVVSDFLSGKVEKQSPLVAEAADFNEYEETECYAKRRDKRSELMLDVRLLDGKRFGLSYSYLRGVFFNGAELLLIFTPHEVTITGKYLLPLYEGVLEHRLRFVQEEGERFEPLAENRTFIAKIDILSPA